MSEIKTYVLIKDFNKNSKTLMCDVTLSIGTGRTDWGAVKGKEYYKLHILTKQLSA